MLTWEKMSISQLDCHFVLVSFYKSNHDPIADWFYFKLSGALKTLILNDISKTTTVL